ncbi:hypothetical protein ACJRO7_021273 [Eucalyptus globulus]|uniref:Ionotropic glutamate receptor C-terminal domain-containing protein n=1 Tax=Eucalyptus globulus TaxID=34317 RepID=A0ABD3KJ94_EUCGL
MGLEYDFYSHHGTYEDLAKNVGNKFTQPFMGSGLSVIVPAKPDTDRALTFMEPFTATMWVASGGLLIYSTIVVGYLERPINPEFGGPWTNQLSTALCFAEEKVHHKFTRIVLVIWFFVALILTQSYTAGLTSMFTVRELRPNVNAMEKLRNSKAKVGCDPDAFICDHMNSTLKFSTEVIVPIWNTSSYGDELRSGNISALFLEYANMRALFTQYCDGYLTIGDDYRFGGFGFISTIRLFCVFPKGPSLAANFFEAILELSQSGEMKRLEKKWFSPDCTRGTSLVRNQVECAAMAFIREWKLVEISPQMLCCSAWLSGSLDST